MHPDGSCPGSWWVRFCDFASLADRIDPNDYRPPMACLSLQALTISDPLKAGLVVTNGRARTTLGDPQRSSPCRESCQLKCNFSLWAETSFAMIELWILDSSKRCAKSGR